ncbi:hypothetical protein [Nautilia sp.]
MKKFRFVLLLLILLGGGCMSTSDNNASDESSNGVFSYFTKLYQENVSESGILSPYIRFVKGVYTADGYILGGSVVKDVNDVNHRGEDGLILKTDQNGNILWKKIIYYNGTEDRSSDVNENFGVAARNGNETVFISDVYPKGSIFYGCFPMIVKIDSDGNILFKGYFYYAGTDVKSISIKDAVYLNGYTYAVGTAVLLLDDGSGTVSEKDEGVILRINNNTGETEVYTYINSYRYIHFTAVGVYNDTLYIGGNLYNDNIQKGLLMSVLVKGDELFPQFSKEFVVKDVNSSREYTDVKGVVADEKGVSLITRDNLNSTAFVNIYLMNFDFNGTVKSMNLFKTSTYYSYYRGMVNNGDTLTVSAANLIGIKIDRNSGDVLSVIQGTSGWYDGIGEAENGKFLTFGHDGADVKEKIYKVDFDIKNCENVTVDPTYEKSADILGQLEIKDAEYYGLTVYNNLVKSDNVVVEDTDVDVVDVCTQ